MMLLAAAPLLLPPPVPPVPYLGPAPTAMAQQQERAEEVPFVLQAEEVARLQAESGLPLELFLASLVKPTLAMARPPISGFHVGAVGLGTSGRVFRGVNLEFPGLPLHHSVHAEQCLVANAGQHGEERLRFIAVSAAPCGHCRQFLQELRGAADMQLVIVDPEVEVHSLPHLLPRRFGPHDLLAEGFPLMLEPHVNNLFLADDRLHFSGSRRLVVGLPSGLFSSASRAPNGVISLAGASNGLRNGGKSVPNGLVLPSRERHRCGIHPNLNGSSNPGRKPPGVDISELTAAALRAANSAYAPYSGCPSGLSLATARGRLYCGSYMESAAYNPSLSPLQSALISFVTQGGGSYEDIVQAVLVETVGAKVQHAGTIELALEKIAAKCSFYVFHANFGNGVASPL